MAGDRLRYDSKTKTHQNLHYFCVSPQQLPFAVFGKSPASFRVKQMCRRSFISSGLMGKKQRINHPKPWPCTMFFHGTHCFLCATQWEQFDQVHCRRNPKQYWSPLPFPGAPKQDFCPCLSYQSRQISFHCSKKKKKKNQKYKIQNVSEWVSFVAILTQRCKYTMYPWSLQTNLFMGGQCTFNIDLTSCLCMLGKRQNPMK